MNSFPREERDRLVREMAADWAEAFPTDDSAPPDKARVDALRERYYVRLAEYLDRLPRPVLSVCPFTETPLKRALDPYGFDGPYWYEALQASIEEPRASAHFLVMLGAVKLERDAPTEASEVVHPGPDVPFVVPALLELPGVVAVMGRVRLETGDLAYPIAYFAEDASKIEPTELHQPWLRDDYWFVNDEGDASWAISNDVWDFELGPWLESGRLRWVDLEAAEPKVLRLGKDAEVCPLVGLPGERMPQTLSDGERDWLDLPSGEVINPFEGAPEPEPDPEESEALLAEARKKAESRGGAAGMRREVEKDTGLTPEEKERWLRTIAQVERDL